MTHKKSNKVNIAKEKENQFSKDSDSDEKSLKTNLSKNKKDFSTIARNILPVVIGVTVVAVLVFVVLAPKIYKTDSSYNDSSSVDHKTVNKSSEELIIEDLLGVESDLSGVADLTTDKVSVKGIHKSYSGEKDCRGEISEVSKKTFSDSRNNFNVIEHEISLKAGIKNNDWKKYTIQSDGLLLKDSYDGKKKKSGKDIWDEINTTSSHYSKYIKYGVLDIQCSVDFQYNYPNNEKGYIKELDEEDDNLLYNIFEIWYFRWGAYANGVLTTDSDTFIVLVGKDSELNNDTSVNALSDSYNDKNPYPGLAEDISPISEIHIFNFNFGLDEETKEFINKWSYAVDKNLKSTTNN